MNLYLVRHGKTSANSNYKYYGAHESELTTDGIIQCENIKNKLQNIKFDKIYCSERKRAKDSAQIILGDLFKVIIDSRLNERDFGIFENKDYNEIKENHIDEAALWEEDWRNYRIPGGESAVDAFKRAEDFLKSIEKTKDENILLITHGGFIRNSYCYVLGSLDFFWKFGSNNGDITVLKYEYGNWFISETIKN